MKQNIHTVRFRCDAWYYRGGNERDVVDCPNTLLLSGTEKEIEELYEQSQWGYEVAPKGQNEVFENYRHVCPRKHYLDSLGLQTPIEPRFVGIHNGLPIYEDLNPEAIAQQSFSFSEDDSIPLGEIPEIMTFKDVPPQGN